MPRLLRTSGLGFAAVLAAGATGCFYVEDINERPSAEIRRIDGGIPLRNGQLSFQALIVDPDGDAVQPSWRFEACNAFAVCAADETGVDPFFTVRVPPSVAGEPTVRIVVSLDVTDGHGAVARPAQRLELDVANNLPTVTVQRSGREIAGKFPPDVPIYVSARGVDSDGDPVALSWELFPPRNSNPAERQFDRLPDPASGGEEYRLFPDVDGEWVVRVTVGDGIDEDVVDLPILVVPDRPPCLGASDPPAVAGTSLILDEPRRISVLVVEDDLDVYPAPSISDPFLDVTAFRWYVRGPDTGGAYLLVATDVAGLELDPAHHDPGDVLDVRVEIDDRIGRAVQCAADVPTCSNGQDACLQRQTWTLEVR